MKKIYTLSFIYIAASLFSFTYADSLTYGKILYRINTGGWFMNSLDTDTSKVGWTQDDQYKPCDYVDTVAMGDKTYGVLNPITPNATVPASTPSDLFKTERDLGKWELTQLEYNFPVPAGQKVEVRLYFSENYYDSITKRVMDIMIEDEVVLSDFDIYAEVGMYVGLMKKFVVTSGADDTLDIDFKRIKQLSMVNGIEIIELNKNDGTTVQGLFTSKKEEVSISAFPNPFTKDVSLDFGNLNPETIRLFDSFGKEIPVVFNGSASAIKINLESYPKGIYYLQAISSTFKTETVRLVKE